MSKRKTIGKCVHCGTPMLWANVMRYEDGEWHTWCHNCAATGPGTKTRKAAIANVGQLKTGGREVVGEEGREEETSREVKF